MGTNLLVVLLMLVGGWVDEEIGCFELKKSQCLTTQFASQIYLNLNIFPILHDTERV